MIECLRTLSVLLVDCQTTANSPAKGHLLEVGWLPCRAVDVAPPDELAVRQHLVRLPVGAALPPQVRRLTGIQPDCMGDAVPASEVWRCLSGAADEVSRQGNVPRCPAVIHFARFERPFLEALHRQYGQAADFPFQFICTYDISRRLYPELPRRGLRALAGFLGYSVPPARRCGGHVRATAVIWRHLVRRLVDEEGVMSLADLRCWLDERPVAAGAARRYPMPSGQRSKAPDAPGIYRFLRSNGDVLYIGKARSLKTRVNSYFQPSRRHSERVLEMLTQAADIEVTVTGTALEAAMMESEAIKRCSPPYNVALTEAGRAPIFVSRDFGRRSHRPTVDCPIGPLVSMGVVGIVRSVGSALVAGIGGVEGVGAEEKALMVARVCPEKTILSGGIEAFREKHADLMVRLGLWRALLRVGRDSWKERLVSVDDRLQDMDEGNLESEKGDLPEETPVEWTPELVCRRIEGLLRHVSHQMRRARWLARLSDSVVAWRRESGEDGLLALVLGGGCVVDCRLVEDVASLPESPGYGRAWREKQVALDLQAYDRLRVLTTELRRLLTEERLVCVRLGANVFLNTGHLGRLLRWV